MQKQPSAAQARPVIMLIIGTLLGALFTAGLTVFNSTALPSVPAVAAGQENNIPVSITQQTMYVIAGTKMYSIREDINERWCERTAAGVTAHKKDGYCHVDVELSLNMYSALHFQGVNVEVGKPAGGKQKFLLAKSGTLKLWIDTNPSYHKLRSPLRTICDSGTFGTVEFQPSLRITALANTSGCQAGGPPTFSI